MLVGNFFLFLDFLSFLSVFMMKITEKKANILSTIIGFIFFCSKVFSIYFFIDEKITRKTENIACEISESEIAKLQTIFLPFKIEIFQILTNRASAHDCHDVDIISVYLTFNLNVIITKKLFLRWLNNNISTIL